MSAAKSRMPVMRNAVMAAIAAGAVAFILISEMAPLRVEASLNLASVLIGDTIRYALVVDMRNGFMLEQPDLDRHFAAFSIRDKKRTVENRFGRRVSRYIYFIAKDEPGEYDIEPVKLRYKRDGESSWREELVRGFHVRVRGILESDTAHKIKVTVDSRVTEYDAPFNYDIKDDVAPKNILTLLDIVFIAISAVAVLIAFFAAAAFLYAGIFRKKPTPEAPDAVALGRLAALRASTSAAALPKEFCFTLSVILKDYLKSRFGMDGRENTTKEFLAELNGLSDAAAHREKIREILMLCDLVKYSDYASSEAELAPLADSAKTIITETR